MKAWDVCFHLKSSNFKKYLDFVKKICIKVSKQVQNFFCENEAAFIVRQSLLGSPVEYIYCCWLAVCNWLPHEQERALLIFSTHLQISNFFKVWKMAEAAAAPAAPKVIMNWNL